MRITKRTAAMAAAAAASTLAATVLVMGPWASAAHVAPERFTGNRTCEQHAAGSTELKIEPVANGSYGDGTLTVTLTNVNKSFNWSSNIPVAVVIVKGGSDSNIYNYQPDGATEDSGLQAPVGKNGQPSGLSHLSFCYYPSTPPPTTSTTTTDPKPTETETSTSPPTTTTDPKGDPFCTGYAYDVRLDVGGALAGYVGPAIKTDKDVFPDKETLSELALTMPGGATQPVVTATTLQAENSGDPITGCTTRITYENLNVDLNNLSDAGGIPVVLTAKAVETIATSKLNPDNTVSTSTEVTIIGGSLSVNGGEPQAMALNPPPNSGFTNQCFGDPEGQLCLAVVLHEQNPIPGGVEANAIRVLVSLDTPIPGGDQSVDLKVAHAEADAHPAP